MKYAEWIYDTMCGYLEKEHCAPGIKNLFAEGEECALLYQQVYDAYSQLCAQNNVQEIEEVETIINALLSVSRVLGYQMFECGMEHSTKRNCDKGAFLRSL